MNIAKIRGNQLLIDNPHPVKDGKVNKFHKGSLIFYNYDTEEYVLVKALKLYDMEEGNFDKQVVLELDNKYHCEKISV